ncbi:MAG: extracellular solute-binding protein [Planctomycetes bacterium]|nr:extracellular solute-binding protein [Planctomycetota bacterium]
MTATRSPFVLAVACLLPLAAATAQAPRDASHSTAPDARVVLCTSLRESAVRPVLRPFEARRGVTVEVVHCQRPTRDQAPAALAAMHAAGGDVWWCQESMSTDALKRIGAFAVMSPPPAGVGQLPAAFRDAEGAWYGFAPRARVLVVNTARLPLAERPRSMWDLLDARFRGQVGLTRPGNGTSLLHLLALDAGLGAAACERFVDGLLANDCVVAPSDRRLAEMVGRGDVLVGMTDTSDYLGARAAGLPVDCVYPDQDGVGALLVPHTAALLASSPAPELGRALIEFLLSAEAEASMVAQDKGQLPLRADTPTPPGVPSCAALRRMTVDLGAAELRAPELGAKLIERIGARLAAQAAVAPSQRPAGTIAIDFDAMAAGAAPTGMTVAQTGGGEPCVWHVTEDPTSRGGGRVVTQLETTPSGRRFPLCIYDGLCVRDVAVQASFKTMTGETDRAAGLCVRYQDADNYYCCRVNSLEDNYRFYKVVDGRRIELAGVDHVQIWEDVWQTMRLEAEGTHFRVWLNGALLFEADDDTFRDAGKVGLWLKGDSHTSMDDLVITAPSRHRAVVFGELGDAAPTAGFVAVVSSEQQAEWQLTAAGGPIAITPVMTGGSANRRGGAMLLDDAADAGDVAIGTRFKVATVGPGMHLAGLVARYRSDDEHYYLRINLEECNLRLYRVHGGEKVLIGERHHTTFDEHQWHTAQLTLVGGRAEVLVDGAVQFVAEDAAPLPAGKVGLWAAPGGDTLFAEVVIDAFD